MIDNEINKESDFTKTSDEPSLNDTKTNALIPIPKEGYQVKLIQESSFITGCSYDQRIPMVTLSILILLFFSIGFPYKISKIVDAEVPHPISPNDPENPVFNTW
jgi:hypothetical protein